MHPDLTESEERPHRRSPRSGGLTSGDGAAVTRGDELASSRAWLGGAPSSSAGGDRRMFLRRGFRN